MIHILFQSNIIWANEDVLTESCGQRGLRVNGVRINEVSLFVVSVHGMNWPSNIVYLSLFITIIFLYRKDIRLNDYLISCRLNLLHPRLKLFVHCVHIKREAVCVYDCTTYGWRHKGFIWSTGMDSSAIKTLKPKYQKSLASLDVCCRTSLTK